jgi:hypothetical protein
MIDESPTQWILGTGGAIEHYFDVPDGDRRFYATAMIIAAPLFLLIWGLFAEAALSDKSGRQIGIVLGAVWLVALIASLRNPYVAVVGPDGSIRFKALTRTLTTSVDAVYRISIVRGRAMTWNFYFNDSKASLGWDGGGALCAYLRAANPAIDGP